MPSMLHPTPDSVVAYKEAQEQRQIHRRDHEWRSKGFYYAFDDELPAIGARDG